MRAIDYLKGLPREWMPKSVERGIKSPSNADLKRWLTMGAITINNKRPSPLDNIELPIYELIFFPNGKRRTTIIKGGEIV